MNKDRTVAPLVLVRDSETDCPVCGRGGAFSYVQQYDVCERCGWVDDPAAYAYPDRASETNDEALTGAVRSWPERLVRQLAKAPLTDFAISARADSIGGWGFVVGGVPLTEIFPAAKGDKASIDPWPGDRRRLQSPLLTGLPDTPTCRWQLYRCHLCGDPLCGSLTADVRFLDDRIVWSRIGRETYDYSAETWQLVVRRNPAGFAFDADGYRRALLDVRSAAG